MTSSPDYVARVGQRCAARCAFVHCTGKGDTHHSSHACPFITDAQLDPHPCAWCGGPAVHLYPSGWLCADCGPSTPAPDPTRTLASRAAGELQLNPCDYGTATTPRPARDHTCRLRKRVERTWSATTSDDCPACQLEAEGWQQLLASFRAALLP